MSKVLIEDTTLSDIADSIRNKNGTETTYKPSEMSSAIDNIPSGGISESGAKIELDTTTNTDIKQFITEVENLDLNGRTSLSGLFNGYSKLKRVSFKDTSNVTNLTNTFKSCGELISITGMDTSKVETWAGPFNGCTKLKIISEIDTSSATGFSMVFQGCSMLEDLPVMNLRNVYFLTNTFAGCDSLSNESLNNILETLKNAYNYGGTKTLQTIGLSETQATTCTTLSNWSTLQSRGWSTGY